MLDATKDRQFLIKRGDKVLLDTRARLVGMDAGAAGWQRKSEAEHGRCGDGISIVFDQAQAPPDSTSGAYGSVAPYQRVVTFFTQPADPKFGRAPQWQKGRFPAAAAKRAEEAAPVLQAARDRFAAGQGSSSEPGAEVPQHCFWCATLDAKFTYVEVDPSMGGGAPVQRWCLGCEQARQRNGLWGPADEGGSEGEAGEEEEARERPAVAAGACSPAGCGGCTLPELPEKARKIRETMNAKNKQRADNSWHPKPKGGAGKPGRPPGGGKKKKVAEGEQ